MRASSRLRVLRAFRQYARLGMNLQHLNPYLVYARLRGSSRSEREALDLLAVYDTVRLLAYEQNGALEAVRAIFFDLSISLQRKNDMTYAVRRYAMAHHYDERTVYRQLARAERLYLYLRSEAVSEEED